MVPDTDSQTAEPAELRLGWTRKISLTARIMAVNLFVIALLAAGLFFLDSYRWRLIELRQDAAVSRAELLVNSLPMVRPEDRPAFVAAFAKQDSARIRLYAEDGTKLMDSFELGPPTYDPAPTETGWKLTAGRWIDSVFDFLVLAPAIPPFVEPSKDVAKSWPELETAKKDGPVSRTRFAPDRTHMVSAAAWSQAGSYGVLATSNDRNIRAAVRAERFGIAMFFLLVLGIAVLLSFFLARTIVRPLRHLARAAVKVRLGRAREVTVPRLPSRRDEIGMLARALSDMSIALRQRIDATESFAADVAHELKNPLASLRSALDGIDRIEDPALRAQLMAVAKGDVLRLDRLISDISEASRVDAQLAKAKFERIDLGQMIEQMLEVREDRTDDNGIKIAFARPQPGTAVVMGEDVRLERMLTNLIDNAVSFSPPDGVVEVNATRSDNKIILRVSDEGPGVPEEEREDIFRRFHSARPDGESFGEHSGLGLAIARTIAEGHDGKIFVGDRVDGKSGASFEILLPAAPEPTQ